MPVPFLGAFLLLCVLSPMILGWIFVGPARPLLDEIAAALGLIGFAALLTDCLLSGRFRLLSGAMGVDRTLRWHQGLGTFVAIALLPLHPFLYTLPDGPAALRPDDAGRILALGLGPWSTATAMLAWLLLGLLCLTALRRNELPYQYENWRTLHAVAAFLIGAFGLHHALVAGRYSQSPVVMIALSLLAALAFLGVLDRALLRPLWLAKRPWRIARVEPAAAATWEVTLEPVDHPGLAYKAGQFAWVKLDQGPFSRHEHPFTIVSAPAEGAALRFVIKESGDFTDGIARLPTGARAYVDGPHGHLHHAVQGAPGIAFLCGGVGIAPALGMIRGLAGRAETVPMQLLYGSPSEAQIVARDELQALADARRLDLGLVLAHPPHGWNGETGVLDAAMITRRCAEAARAGWNFVLCGPPPMLRAATAALRGLGVAQSRIFAERFTFD